MKRCNECKKLLQNRQRRWCSHICEVTYWQRNNREKVNRYKKNYLSRYPQRRKESVKKYDASEKGKNAKLLWKKNNRERLHELWRLYSRRYRDRNVAQTAKRRAVIKGLNEHFSKKEWVELKKRYDFKCLDCGKKEPTILLTPDHIVPLIPLPGCKGGSNVIDNIQPLCKTCNFRKNNRKIIDYRKLV